MVESDEFKKYLAKCFRLMIDTNQKHNVLNSLNNSQMLREIK